MNTVRARVNRRTLFAGSGALALAAGVFGVAPGVAGAKVGYDRTKAVTWARGRVYDDPDPIKFDNNCTWYVSKVLWVGGLPQDADWTNSSPDPTKWASKWTDQGPTKTAAHADSLKNHLINKKYASIRELNWRQNDVPDAQIGDVIGYDWDNGADGYIDHLMVVTGFSGKYPLVSGHSLPRLDAGWTWSDKANDWIERAYTSHTGNPPRAYLLHINT